MREILSEALDDFAGHFLIAANVTGLVLAVWLLVIA